MSQYNKLIVAAVGLAVLLGAQFGLDLTAQQDAIVQVVTAVLTAFGIYQVPNKAA